MKVIFLDIDGVIQPLWQQKRFKHMDEIEELAKELDVKIPGHSYYDYVTKYNYPDSTQGIYSENGLLEHFSPYMTSKSIFLVCLTAYHMTHRQKGKRKRETIMNLLRIGLLHMMKDRQI